MTLLAIIIAFALFHWVHKPDWMTSFDVFEDLNVFLRDKLGVDVVPARIVLILVVPLLILALLLELFDVSAFHHHGGVRYLAQGDVGLVREAVVERGLLTQNAPHLVRNQSFIIPTHGLFDEVQ